MKIRHPALRSASLSPSPKAPAVRDAQSVYRAHLDFGRWVKGGWITPQWLADGSSFCFLLGDPADRTVFKFDAARSTIAPFFDLTRLRRALTDALGYEPSSRGVPFERYSIERTHTVCFDLDGETFRLNLHDYTLAHVTTPSRYAEADLVCSESDRDAVRSFPRWKFIGTGRREPSPEVRSPDGRWIAGIDRDNLVLRATIDGQAVRMTEDGTPDAFWDVEGALWNPWSPNGMHLAVFKQHIAGMPRIPVVEYLKPWEQTRELIAMPAGGTLYRSQLFLLELCSRHLRPIDLGDTTDHYLRVLTWWADSSELLIARYDRQWSHVQLLAVEASTGAVRTILTERSETFLTNQHEALWSPNPGFYALPDGSGFIWNSERSGWDHLYLYDRRGELVRALTHGDWRVQEVLRVDLTGGWVYFTGHDDVLRPYDTHFYRVRLDGQELTRLTEGPGQHEIQLSPSANIFIDTLSSVDEPPQTVLRACDGRFIHPLAQADVSRLAAQGWTPPREYVVKAADGCTDLWVTMYLPYDFDERKRYPLIEYIYAGPQSIWRPLDFGDRPADPLLSRPLNFYRALANLGFAVVVLDGRGTPGRSKAFHDAVYGRFGQFEIADHVSAIRELGARLGFLDLDRAGVAGMSWGGQFAFRAMTQAPELYKVGVCEVPALDPKRLTLYEPYLGLPQRHPQRYEAADPFALAPQLKGKLLLIGAMSDPFTPADFFKLSETLIRLGIHHDSAILPYSGHIATGQSGEYVLELKKRFFLEHLAS